MATPLALDCPDPHQPDPAADVELRSLEKALVAAAGQSTADTVREGSADGVLRAYVDHLHALGCPPEHMVIRVKRLLLRATRSVADRDDATALCEAMILRSIQTYFDR